MGLAITKTCEHVAEAATLIHFLLNEEKGASIMGSECGIPASKAGLAAAQAAGAVKDLVADANAKVMAFTTNKLDPLFENNDLKASGTGIYQEVFDTVDYDDDDRRRGCRHPAGRHGVCRLHHRLISPQRFDLIPGGTCRPNGRCPFFYQRCITNF